jgi:7,8-dihydropterin-6-yl-methyl-4-(beta-D-ribofuranosyl)aminobenzene 5'-phosphate synthase
MTITALMDNYCQRAGLRGEHGLSLHVRTREGDLLFDTGSTGAFLKNARFLGVDLSSLSSVVLSHGHYDHSGGLTALYEGMGNGPPLFVGTGYDRNRWAVSGESRRSIGLCVDAAVLRHARVVEGVVEVLPGAFLLPAAERLDGSEPLRRFRAMRGEEERLDEFEDELSLAVVEDGGLVVITGCAHRGALNIVKQAMDAFSGHALKAVIGGLHLSDAPEAELGRVAEGLAAFVRKGCTATTARASGAMRPSIKPWATGWPGSPVE